MKTMMITAALLLGTAAVAQTTQAPQTMPETPTSMPQTATMPNMPQGAASTGEAETTARSSTAPDNAMPAPGSTTATMPATMPATADAAPAGETQAARMASADTSNYPVCSRAIRDKCVNRGAHRR